MNCDCTKPFVNARNDIAYNEALNLISYCCFVCVILCDIMNTHHVFCLKARNIKFTNRRSQSVVLQTSLQQFILQWKEEAFQRKSKH